MINDFPIQFNPLYLHIKIVLSALSAHKNSSKYFEIPCIVPIIYILVYTKCYNSRNAITDWCNFTWKSKIIFPITPKTESYVINKVCLVTQKSHEYIYFPYGSIFFHLTWNIFCLLIYYRVFQFLRVTNYSRYRYLGMRKRCLIGTKSL